MNHVLAMIALALIPLAGASGQENRQKHSFPIAVKAGDVITDKVVSTLQMTLKVGDQTVMRQTTKTTKDEVITIEKVDAQGKVLQLLAEVRNEDVARETDVRGQTKQESNKGPFHGVAVRSTWKDRGYEKTLISGESNPPLAKKLAEAKTTVLNAELVPTKPLAIGESQVVEDQERVRTMLSAFGEGGVFSKPFTITLKEIKKVGAVNTAVFDEIAQINAPIRTGSGVTTTVLMDVHMTVAYDIDQKFLNHVVMSVKGTGEIEQNGMKIVMEMSGDAESQATKNGASKN